jgi:HSP20 family molecular chaperone IbpA
MLFAPLNTTMSLNQRRPSFQAFEKFLGDVVKSPSSVYSFKQTETGYNLQIDVPGVSKEQLQIQIEEQLVRIQTLPEVSRKYMFNFELPQVLDSTQCTAKLEHGVLNLTLTSKKPDVVSNTLTIE